MSAVRDLDIQEVSEAILDDLDALGCTADGVTEALVDLGIKGLMLEPSECPFARYLRSQYPTVQFTVLDEQIVVTYHGDDATVQLPAVVAEVLGEFDRGLRPMLDERPLRPWTPDRRHGDSTTVTVKRACNGCSSLLGDVTAAELDAAIIGRPLPDVRVECARCMPIRIDARLGLREAIDEGMCPC